MFGSLPNLISSSYYSPNSIKSHTTFSIILLTNEQTDANNDKTEPPAKSGGANIGHEHICELLEVHSELSGLADTLRWFTAGGAFRIAVRQLSQTWKLRHYDVIDDVIIWVQDGNCKKWLERILVLVRSTI